MANRCLRVLPPLVLGLAAPTSAEEVSCEGEKILEWIERDERGPPPEGPAPRSPDELIRALRHRSPESLGLAREAIASDDELMRSAALTGIAAWDSAEALDMLRDLIPSGDPTDPDRRALTSPWVLIFINRHGEAAASVARRELDRGDLHPIDRELRQRVLQLGASPLGLIRPDFHRRAVGS